MTGSHRRRSFAVGLTLAIAIATGATSSVTATFPGSNGRIAFSQDNGLGDQLFTANADGSDIRPLIDAANSFPGGLPDWSPDGKTILFDSGHASTEAPPGPGFHIDVYAVSAKGGTPRRLTFSGLNLKASWSPDGRRIAFERSDADCTDDHISTMNADGSNIRDLTTNPYGNCQTEEDASFSPDGEHIVFQRHRPGADHQESALFVMRSDGTHLHRITPWAMEAGQPDWSPNGKWILFNTSSDNFSPMQQLYIVHPDGTGLTKLTEDTGADVSFEASWSPDGTKILFSHFHFTPEVFESGLRVMNANGTGIRNLPGTSLSFNPDWGPKPARR
jgi:Tol biopolymer transport system component